MSQMSSYTISQLKKYSWSTALAIKFQATLKYSSNHRVMLSTISSSLGQILRPTTEKYCKLTREMYPSQKQQK